MATLGSIFWFAMGFSACCILVVVVALSLFPRRIKTDEWDLEPEPMKPVDRRFREAQGYE